MDLKISVITVCYNSAETIEQTICSVLDQSYVNVEYLIIDGGSCDGTVDIIRKYEDRIAYWVSEPDQGIYDAMNKGIAEATGDIIAFLNSDDWYEPGALKYVADYFENENIQVLAGLLYYWVGQRREAPSSFISDAWTSMISPHPATFVQRQLFVQYGGFDVRYAISADYEWLLRIYNEGVPFRYCQERLVNMRSGGCSNKKILVAHNESLFAALSAAFALKAEKKISEKEYCDLAWRINTVKRRSIRYQVARIAIDEKWIAQDEKLKEGLKELLSQEGYSLFGCGKAARRCRDFLFQLGKKIICCYDNDTDKWNTNYNGIMIQTPLEINRKNKIIITTEKYEAEICEQLEEYGLVKDIDFYCFSHLLYHVGEVCIGETDKGRGDIG